MGVHTKGVHPVTEGPFLTCLSYMTENRFIANSASSKLSRDFLLARQRALNSRAHQEVSSTERVLFSYYDFFQRKRATLLSSLGYHFDFLRAQKNLLHFLQEKGAERSFTWVLADCCHSPVPVVSTINCSHEHLTAFLRFSCPSQEMAKPNSLAWWVTGCWQCAYRFRLHNRVRAEQAAKCPSPLAQMSKQPLQHRSLKSQVLRQWRYLCRAQPPVTQLFTLDSPLLPI